MNPNTATRDTFTQAQLNASVPTNAAEDYRKLFTTLQRLLGALAQHEGMRPNLQQPFMEPANSKNKVYFMWDFIGRSLGELSAIDPALPHAQKPRFNEVLGRAIYARTLIEDTTGMLDTMMAGSGAGNVQFGQEIKTIAAEIV